MELKSELQSGSNVQNGKNPFALFPKDNSMYLLHYFTMIHHSLTQQKSISEHYLGFIFHLEISKPDSPVKMWGELTTAEITKNYLLELYLNYTL